MLVAIRWNGRCSPTGETEVLPVDNVITCIGYYVRELEGVPIADWKSCYKNEDGKIDEGLWAVGWPKTCSASVGLL